MNKSYRSIWNESLGAWVAASEISRARGKRSTSAVLNAVAAAGVALSLSTGAQAAGFAAIGTATTTSTAGPSNACVTQSAFATFGDSGTWSCLGRTAGGGLALINGITATAATAGTTNLDTRASGSDALAFGNTATTAAGGNSIAFGSGAVTTVAGSSAIAIGTGANASGGASIAMGDGAISSNGSTVAIGGTSAALGGPARATQASGVGATAVGAGALASATGATALGDSATASANYTGALGTGSKADGQRGMAFGNNARAREDDTAFGAGALTGSLASARTVAVGALAGANAAQATESVFVGATSGAGSNGTRNVYTGFGAGSTGAVGSLNAGSGNYALAASNGSNNVGQGTGAGAVVAGDKNVSLGYLAGTKATVDSNGNPTGITGAAYSGAVNVGSQTQAYADGAVAVGTSSAAGKAGGVAVGQDAVASGERGAAVGAGATASNDFATALGNGAKALGGHTVAVGVDANASGLGATAIGRSATAAAERGTALGADTSVAATAAGGVALGQSSQANTAAGALGFDSATGATAAAGSAIANTVGTRGAVSLGNATDRRQITNLAAGSADTDAVNVAQLKAGQTHYFSVQSSNPADGNYNNKGATGTDAIAIGKDASATGVNSVAMGRQTTAGSNEATAIGFESKALGQSSTAMGYQSNAFGTHSISLGYMSAANNNGTALGTAAKATGLRSTALGTDSKALASGSVAVGDQAIVDATAIRGVAIGYGANVTLPGGVALGLNSVTAAASPTASVTVDGTTYDFAGITPASVVSVGSVGAERQVTNVAAGRISGTSTDAINGSQLHATNQAVNTLGDQAVRYTINPDGTVNYNSVTLNPGGTGPTTISNVAAGSAPTDAVNVSQLTTVANTANKGWNLSANGEATPQNIAPGGTVDFANGDNIEISRVGNKITVATAKDVSFDSVTTGDTVMNNAGITVGTNVALGSTGLTIVGGPSVTTSGIDAGNQFITNVKAGVNPTDGVNVSQLTTVSNEAGKGWQLQANGDTSSKVAPGDTVQFIDGKNIRVTRTGGNVTVATADDVAFNSVVVGTTVISSGNVQVGPNVALGSTGLTIVGGPSVTIAGIDAGNQYITNVKAGVNATDGVNVSQLNTAVSGASNKWITGSQTTTYVAPSATGPESTAMGSASSATGANSTAVGTGAVASVNNSVALGNGSTTTAATATPSTTIRGTTYNFAGANPDGVVSVGSAGAERQIQNVAAGQLNANSTDAINGSQLYATNLALESISAVAGAGINVTTAATGTGIAIGTSVANVGPGGTATYTAGNNMVLTQNGTNTTFAVNDNPNFNSVTVGGTSITQSGINAGGNVISNVAPGVAGTDAVNVNQLNSASAANNAYTDARVNGLGNEMRGIAKNAYAGVAAAMAVQMPGSYVPGKTVMRIGGAVFKGESAVGVSFRRTAENNGWSLTGGVGLSRAGAAVTAGVEWVFN